MYHPLALSHTHPPQRRSLPHAPTTRAPSLSSTPKPRISSRSSLRAGELLFVLNRSLLVFVVYTLDSVVLVRESAWLVRCVVSGFLNPKSGCFSFSIFIIGLLLALLL